MLGGETSAPLLISCLMQTRTGTSALSALPVRSVGPAKFPFLQTGNLIFFL